MPCFKPITAYQKRDSTDRRLYFKQPPSVNFDRLEVGCGQCIGCRLEYGRQWAVRIMHEAQMHRCNSFITLTYDDEHLPYDGSLVKPHFQKFMKRLRKKLYPLKLRYFMCGEYGEKLGRPHYHACVFNLDLPDRQLWKTVNGVRLYTSQTLDAIWGKGFTTIGSVTFESAAYVARYTLKKKTGKEAEDHYFKQHPIVDMQFEVEPEYADMSRRPGIGTTWLDKFETDVFPSDEVIVRGFSQKPPRFYDEIYRRDNEKELEELKKKRTRRAQERWFDNTNRRLKAREICTEARINTLKRKLDND